MLVLLLLAAMLMAVTSGDYHGVGKIDALRLSWAKIWGLPMNGFTGEQEVIVWRLRFPRMLLALTTGVALAVSGMAYQACFRNPLVEPYILGVSSGAAFGAGLAIIFPFVFPQIQVSAFAFALSAVGLTYFLAYDRRRSSTIALILSGIIVGALFSAAVGAMKYLAEDSQLRELTFWMMGSFHFANWAAADLNFKAVIPCFIALWLLGWKLNLLSLGDEESRSLGLHPGLLRFVVVFIATLAAAVCVSQTGIIAWVGLMMPHAARMLMGSDHRWAMPAAAIMGAIYLLLCDTLARTLTGAEIPIGIVTSIVGAPYLLWLLRSKGRSLDVV